MESARLPRTLDVATWVRGLLAEMPPAHPESSLAATLQVDLKTVRAWLNAKATEHGPSVQIKINTQNYQALCDEGRRQGRNVEMFCTEPAAWSYERGLELPPNVIRGKQFKCHGVKIGGLFFDSPLVLSGGVFSDSASSIRWFLKTGFSGVETKSRLSHRREGYRQEQLLTLAEQPSLDAMDFPRAAGNVLTQEFDPAAGYGVGVRMGAPSMDAPAWISETKALVSELRGGQVLLLSIAAHLPSKSGPATREKLFSEWSRIADHASETRAPGVVANVSCLAFAAYYGGDLKLMAEVCKLVRQRLNGAQKLFVKLPYLTERQTEDFLIAANGAVDGLIAINCEPATACYFDLEGQRGQKWSDRESRIGIAGPVLHPLNTAFVQQFARLRSRHTEFRHVGLIACGGVYHEYQISELLGMGADAVGMNSVLFRDVFFGLKSRRYIDSEPYREAARRSGERVRLFDVWQTAYSAEVLMPALSDSEYEQRSRNATRLLHEVMGESRDRLNMLEVASAGGVKPYALMSLAEMRERIRDGFPEL